MTIKDKLSSRKFWLSAAAFLSSLGISIAGFTTENEAIAVIGVVCSAISAAIYAACEAVIDKAAVTKTEETETEEI
ncbi:MAG: hypothetical protein LUF33_00100 [Clostridiales bacterium]|nr:hypothetical protein [Clostridiales bacterium]